MRWGLVNMRLDQMHNRGRVHGGQVDHGICKNDLPSRISVVGYYFKNMYYFAGSVFDLSCRVNSDSGINKPLQWRRCGRVQNCLIGQEILKLCMNLVWIASDDRHDVCCECEGLSCAMTNTFTMVLQKPMTCMRI